MVLHICFSKFESDFHPVPAVLERTPQPTGTMAMPIMATLANHHNALFVWVSGVDTGGSFLSVTALALDSHP